MADVEKTFAIIKPDAVRRGKASEIMQLIELNGFTIISKQKLQVGWEEVPGLHALLRRAVGPQGARPHLGRQHAAVCMWV